MQRNNWLCNNRFLSRNNMHVRSLRMEIRTRNIRVFKIFDIIERFIFNMLSRE